VASIAAGPVGAEAIGTAIVAPGLVARFEYHYDRNALRDSRRVGEDFVALTEAGNLLLFTGKSLTPVRERFGPVPVTALGQDGAGGLVVGYADGVVARVDPATLSSVAIARLPGSISWISSRKSKRESADALIALVRRSPSATEVHDLDRGRVHRLKAAPSVVFLDSKGRFWMGADHGEFGGWCRVLDLNKGTQRDLPGPGHGRDSDGWEGVYGFVELPDGAVWAYGGIAHMGFNDGYITRVDVPRSERLASFGRVEVRGPPPPGQPKGPITLMVVDSARDEVVVFSYGDVYRVDRRLRSWQKVHSLDIHYRWGRPDAVGSYPSVRAVHLLDGGRELLLATRVDGYVRVRAGAEQHFAISDQLGARSIGRIEPSGDGILFIEEDDDVVWRLERGRWRLPVLTPPVDIDPADPAFSPPQTVWSETKVLVGPKGEVTTVNAGAISPGTRTTAQRDKGVTRVLGRERSDLGVASSFVTPDASLWNVWYGDVKRFSAGHWVTVGHYAARPPAQVGIDVGWGLRPLSGPAPPWILHDSVQGQLLRLTPDLPSRAATIERVEILDSHRARRRVFDALTWEGHQLLLATDAGLAIYSGEARLGRSPFELPSGKITRLGRDQAGRLWLGGKGLWVVDRDRATVRSLAAVPLFAGSTIEALASDPGGQGVLASIGERGVVRIHLAAP